MPHYAHVMTTFGKEYDLPFSLDTDDLDALSRYAHKLVNHDVSDYMLTTIDGRRLSVKQSCR